MNWCTLYSTNYSKNIYIFNLTCTCICACQVKMSSLALVFFVILHIIPSLEDFCNFPQAEYIANLCLPHPEDRTLQSSHRFSSNTFSCCAWHRKKHKYLSKNIWKIQTSLFSQKSDFFSFFLHYNLIFFSNLES